MVNTIRCSAENEISFEGFEALPTKCYYHFCKGKMVLTGRKSDFFDQTPLTITSDTDGKMTARDTTLANYVSGSDEKKLHFILLMTGDYVETY